MKQITIKKEDFKEVFSQALKDGTDLELDCLGVKYVLKSGALMKLTKDEVFILDGKVWRKM